MFRLLNSSGTGVINLHEFYQIYDALDMHWRVKKEQPFWFSHVRSKPLAFVVNQVHRLVTWNIFDYFVCEFNLEIFCFFALFPLFNFPKFFSLCHFPGWNTYAYTYGLIVGTYEQSIRTGRHLGNLRLRLM